MREFYDRRYIRATLGFELQLVVEHDERFEVNQGRRSGHSTKRSDFVVSAGSWPKRYKILLSIKLQTRTADRILMSTFLSTLDNPEPEARML